MSEWVKFGLGWIFCGFVATGVMEGLKYKTSSWDIIIWPRFLAFEITNTLRESEELAAKEAAEAEKEHGYKRAVYRDYYYRKENYYTWPDNVR